MLREVSIKKVKNDAEEIFRIGGFYCSEAIVHSVRKNMDMVSGEHKAQRVMFTGEMAGKTAEIIARELGLSVVQAGA